MSRAHTRANRNRIRIWNWLGTLFLCIIPGVNIIALFLFLFLAKAQPKRTFAGAALLLILLLALLTLAAFIVFPAEIKAFAENLRDLARLDLAAEALTDVLPLA